LRRAARRHDLVALRIEDPLDRRLPEVGWTQVQDPEYLTSSGSAAVCRRRTRPRGGPARPVCAVRRRCRDLVDGCALCRTLVAPV
jgi:hypothetical protein